MNRYEELLSELESKAGNDDLWYCEDSIIEELSKTYSPEELSEPLFKLMEKYPLTEWGMPGAIVHFLESPDNELYSEKLLDSLKRQPTVHTVWMLNRELNAAAEPQKSTYLSVMKDIAGNNSLPDEIRSSAEEFIDYQNKKAQSVPPASSGGNSVSLSDIFGKFFS